MTARGSKRKAVYLACALLALLLLGGCARASAGAEDYTSDEVVQRILSTPLSAWMNDADGYGDLTLADVFNKTNFYSQKWLVNPCMTAERDTLAVYWGYVRSGSGLGTLAVLHVLCDEDGGRCTADYAGYISQDEKTLDEASARDGTEGISRVLSALCRSVGIGTDP